MSLYNEWILKVEVQSFPFPFLDLFVFLKGLQNGWSSNLLRKHVPERQEANAEQEPALQHVK